jgi:hypothetical protein
MNNFSSEQFVWKRTNGFVRRRLQNNTSRHHLHPTLAAGLAAFASQIHPSTPPVPFLELEFGTECL